MGSGRLPRNDGAEQSAGAARWRWATQRSIAMADDREKISNGPNARPVNENIAGTAPGIPDDTLAPGEDLPKPPSAEDEERIREKLGAPKEEVDSLPLKGQ